MLALGLGKRANDNPRLVARWLHRCSGTTTTTARVLRRSAGSFDSVPVHSFLRPPAASRAERVLRVHDCSWWVLIRWLWRIAADASRQLTLAAVLFALLCFLIMECSAL